MPSPTSIHTAKTSQVMGSSPATITMMSTMPRIGSTGKSGVLKPRGNSGCFLRRTMTPMLTIVKAPRVPMLVASAS